MKIPKSIHIWLFFAAVYLFSGLFYTAVLYSGEGVYTTINKILMVCVAFTPSLLGMLFVTVTSDKTARQDFWRRVLRWPRAAPGIICVSLGVLPALNIIAYIAATSLSGEPASLSYGAELLTQLPLLAQFLLVEFFLGAVSEELGWRGYALDELQTKYNALTSSLILGLIWAFWHTPAFFIPGLSQFEFGGIFSWNYICMMIAVPAGSIIHTWSYNNTRRSIAVAGILMHFVQNASLIFLGGIFDQYTVPTLFWPVLTCLTVVVAIILVWQYGAQTLAHRKVRSVN